MDILIEGRPTPLFFGIPVVAVDDSLLTQSGLLDIVLFASSFTTPWEMDNEKLVQMVREAFTEVQGGMRDSIEMELDRIEAREGSLVLAALLGACAAKPVVAMGAGGVATTLSGIGLWATGAVVKGALSEVGKRVASKMLDKLKGEAPQQHLRESIQLHDPQDTASKLASDLAKGHQCTGVGALEPGVRVGKRYPI